MPVLAAGLYLALVARSGVRIVVAKRTGSAKAIPAALAAMSFECHSCRDERDRKDLPPMMKIKLPPASTEGRTFKRPQVPVFLCPYCDGEGLVSNAVAQAKKRQAQ